MLLILENLTSTNVEHSILSFTILYYNAVAAINKKNLSPIIKISMTPMSSIKVIF